MPKRYDWAAWFLDFTPGRIGEVSFGGADDLGE
jgi:hypothetical protein